MLTPTIKILMDVKKMADLIQRDWADHDMAQCQWKMTRAERERERERERKEMREPF
jgi:hypothetical protein